MRRAFAIECFGKARVFPAPVAAVDFFLADLFFLDLFFPTFLVGFGFTGSASAVVVVLLSSPIDETSYISFSVFREELGVDPPIVDGLEMHALYH